MARANAATSSFCLDTPTSGMFAASRNAGGQRPAATPPVVDAPAPRKPARVPSPKPSRVEPTLRRVVPIAAVLFLLLLLSLAIDATLGTYYQVEPEALAELETIGQLAADDIHAALRRAEPGAPPSVVLGSARRHVFARGRSVMLTDREGQIVAASPEGAAHGALAARLGGAPLAVLGEKAGAMRISGPNGDLLASVRNLEGPFGQIAVVQPLEQAFAEWRASALRTVLLLLATSGMLGLLGFAFYTQARRAAQAEAERARIRARMDAALDRGRCGLWDWNLATGRIHWSESMYDLLSMPSREEFLSFGEIRALLHPEDGDLVGIAEDLTAGRLETVDHAFRMRNANGAFVWLRARAQVIRDAADGQPHLVGIAIDISEEKRLAERSAASDRRLRDAVETISAAFVLWDEHNRLVLCNSKFQRLHGLSDACVAAGATYAQVMAHSQPVVQESETVHDADGGGRVYEARLADGRWLQINERRTKDGGYVSVGADISDLKRHEQGLLEGERKLMATIADLRKSRQTLELQAQQLAELAERYLEQKAAAESANRAKSHFLANMSHELRTPLTHIIGFAEMMENQIFGDIGHARYLGYAGDIRKSGEYLRAVIGDVLEMSRLEAGVVALAAREFDFAPALDRAIEAFSACAEAKQVTLSLESSGSETAYADTEAFDKILDTLLKNALKFTPQGGRVTLRGRCEAAGCEIVVEDSGCGMSAQEIEQACHPFEQTSPLMEDGMKGPGLGLSIARSLVELHGGRLQIESAPGQGARVRFALPGPRHASAEKIALTTAA
ncbi:PAS domain S-box protein [Rhodoblastus acidophilus]|uniref:histidine kinase n=2 Tax=Rhodoblastus acidophilus TaxID=1074 RepID=A0A6N8DQL8_RHOAC|nr:PAS domain S-box protein [Rhodoblastus acidophilus]